MFLHAEGIHLTSKGRVKRLRNVPFVVLRALSLHITEIKWNAFEVLILTERSFEFADLQTSFHTFDDQRWNKTGKSLKLLVK